ncbi:MAG TPA: GNAT family N-acetyltransferase [Devosia sp.]|nr:GNAT family N-acetyltransferase [Devosia sp.]
MSVKTTTRPARKSDASEIALLVNIAVHGGIAQGWAHADEAAGTYDPIEVGRLEMMRDDTEFGWKSVTIAEVDGEVTGMLLGYRKPDDFEPVPDTVTGFMRPIEELEAGANGRWFISMLGVHVKWRSRGVGSALLDVAEIKCGETQAHGLALIVEDSNSGARRLYERRGYAVRETRPMLRTPGGSSGGRDWLLMVKE